MSATLAARARTNATLSMPPRRATGGRRQLSASARLLRWLGRRPGRALVILLFSAVAAAIMLNALVFQKGRHPAPMLSAPSARALPVPAAERRADAPAAQPQAAAPQGIPTQQDILPPVRPGSLPQAQREANPRPPATVAPAPRAGQAAPAARPAPARDPIADLINGADLRPPAEIRGTATARASAPRRGEN